MQNRWLIAVMTAFMCAAVTHAAEDWPMFRGDAARSAYTANRMPRKLVLAWKRTARHEPSPAWSGQPRLAFDHTYHPVVFGGLVFFGSSTDNTVYALDAATGAEVWTFTTDAPVRVAPAVCSDGVFAGSDDGVLYCLDVKSGRLKWKHRAAPDDERIMGNDRLISRWAVRGGPAIRDGVVYFGAGIWPTEGTFITALDVRDGKVIWKNDTSGSTISNKPRAGSNVKSGPGSQGHLAVGAGVVVVPTGRAAPACYDMKTGSLKYFHHAVYVNKASGGTKAAILGEFVACGENYAEGYRNSKTRLAAASDGQNINAPITAVSADHPQMMITGTSNGLAGFAKTAAKKQRTERDGKVTTYLAMSREPIWECKTPFAVRDIVASENVILISGEGQLALIDIKTKQVLARAKVEGKVQSLAVADGRVYAAAEDGAIFCFSADGGGRVVTPRTSRATSDDHELASVAKAILARTNVAKGYCLDIGCKSGKLAYELAIQSDLTVYGVETDRRKVAAARKFLNDRGLHGRRVTILHVDDLNRLPFAGRFAELVVSSRALTEGAKFLDAGNVQAMLCPYFGVACLGKADALTLTRRGPVKGAGDWTHFYADPQNSYCGTDTALRGPLELLWFRDTDYGMADRHSMSSPTMVYKGYMVMPGQNGVRVANVYNGRVIWQYDIPGLNVYPGGFSYDRRKLSGNMCVADGKVYVRHADYCLCFDIATGRVLGKWSVPTSASGAKLGRWGYVACKDGVLYGSAANSDFIVNGYPLPGSREAEHAKTQLAERPGTIPNHPHPDSTTLFAMDAATGKVKWTFRAKHSIRNTTVTIGKDMIYFVDKPVTLMDDHRFRTRGKPDADLLAAKARSLAAANGTTVEAELENLKAPAGRVVALDSRTGKVKWQSDAKASDANSMAVSLEHGLLMTGDNSRFVVLDALSGKPLWKGGGRGRPMVYGKELRFDTQVLDLMTGKRIRSIPNVRGSYCTPILGSPNMIAFRVGVIGYVDLTAERGTEYFGGIRPGCYVDMTPAGGLLVMSDGASGCGCSYLNQCTIALQPRDAK